MKDPNQVQANTEVSKGIIVIQAVFLPDSETRIRHAFLADIPAGFEKNMNAFNYLDSLMRENYTDSHGYRIPVPPYLPNRNGEEMIKVSPPQLPFTMLPESQLEASIAKFHKKIIEHKNKPENLLKQGLRDKTLSCKQELFDVALSAHTDFTSPALQEYCMSLRWLNMAAKFDTQVGVNNHLAASYWYNFFGQLRNDPTNQLVLNNQDIKLTEELFGQSWADQDQLDATYVQGTLDRLHARRNKKEEQEDPNLST
jgi:hypothetical protein